MYVGALWTAERHKTVSMECMLEHYGLQRGINSLQGMYVGALWTAKRHKQSPGNVCRSIIDCKEA